MNNKNFFRISPLGGVGEIGSNMTVFETIESYIIVDYGILFPSDDFFDINYLIVDIEDLKTDKEMILFMTHAHEDHIGAVSHFVQKFPKIQIHAPEFAYQLIKYKLESRKLPVNVDVYNKDSVFKFSEFEMHPVHVTHSIPHTFGIIWKALDDSLSTLFISDFKFDLTPSFEAPFDTEKVKRIFSSAKKRIALLDSTNILNPGKTVSETELIPQFEEIFEKKGRVFLTMFASNTYRMKNILDVAKKSGRQVSTIGRSITNYLTAANEAKILNLEDYKIVDFNSVQNYDHEKMLYIVTGSQGEFMGATKRIANGDQKNITLNHEDRFVFSSKPIPGNEKKIAKLQNQLTERGTELITSRDKLIHASGHPGQEDLKQLMQIANPTHLIPIHGETYFLRKHAEFSNEFFPHVSVHVLENFQGIDFTDNQIKHFALPKKEPLLIHGNYLVIEREKVSERRKLACNGLVTIAINQKEQMVSVETRGLPKSIDPQLLKLKEHIEYLAFSEFKKRDYDYTKEQIRIKVRNFFKPTLGYKPITIVQLV